ncbi:MAG: hypothetical protein ACP5JG_15940 [Anaerolineae bacterium]
MSENEQGTYEAPQIIYEGDLEIRAGSNLPTPGSGSLDEFDDWMGSGH